MIDTCWPKWVGRVLLVLGLVAGPWPAALASSASASHRTVPSQQAENDAPCPMEERAATPPCHCCDDGAPCSGAQCMLSTAPGVPVRVPSFVPIPDVVRHHVDPLTRPPEPRPGERLRPPIA